MRFDDLKKLFTGPVLIKLDRIITPKLITLFYLSGLAGIGLWGINHLFFSFRFGLGNGVWGLLEIAIFGTLAFIALRAICEFALVFFETHKDVVDRFSQNREISAAPSLIDDVREAIEDLARNDIQQRDIGHNDAASNAVPPSARVEKVSAPKPAPQSTKAQRSPVKNTSGKPPKRTAPRRTAKRAPKSNRS